MSEWFFKFGGRAAATTTLVLWMLEYNTKPEVTFREILNPAAVSPYEDCLN